MRITKFGLILFCLLISFFSVVDNAGAVSIGIKPKEIKTSVSICEQKTIEVLIKNTGQEPAMYKVFTDSYTDNIKIKPDIFKLESREEKVLKVIFKFRLPGKVDTNLSVVARPLDINGVAASPGVKIPVNINIGFSRVMFFLAFALLLLVICLITFFVLRLRKNK